MYLDPRKQQNAPAKPASAEPTGEDETMDWKIEKDGYFFRAVNGSFRSSPFTSPSQVGFFIQRKAGKEAHAAAAHAFMASA